MSGKDKLKDMLDAIVNNNSDSAKVTFHSYLQDKFKTILNTGEADVKLPTSPKDPE